MGFGLAAVCPPAPPAPPQGILRRVLMYKLCSYKPTPMRDHTGLWLCSFQLAFQTLIIVTKNIIKLSELPPSKSQTNSSFQTSKLHPGQLSTNVQTLLIQTDECTKSPDQKGLWLGKCLRSAMTPIVGESQWALAWATVCGLL